MFKKVVATVFALAFIAGALASSPLKLNEVRAESDAWRVVSGVVTLAKNGDPVAGVIVGLFRPGQPTPFKLFTTNAEGKYRFTEVPSGDYRIKPLSTEYRYRPGFIKVTVGLSNILHQNFQATPSGTPVN